MRGWTRPLVVALVLLLTVTAPASAADTGSVSGAVFDRDGQPVAEATVRITGRQLPVRRTVQTGANGIYRVEYLEPGEYTIEIDKPGLGSSTGVATVQVGKDAQLDVVLGLTVQAEVMVRAVTPRVDVRSSEVSFNFKSDTLNSLPLERSYRGLFQLIPGVADNRSGVGPAAGGNRQDNTYLIDGANITNPSFGHLGTDVNELDIAEVNLKRAGISAEFGRTSGSVTNAVSRSGSNRLSGIGRIDWLPASLVSGHQLPDDLLAAGVRRGAFPDQLLTTEAGAAIGLGGPIVTDHVFFYGSARYVRKTKWNRVNKVGTDLPDEVRSAPEFYGKISATPTQSHQLTLNYRHRPDHVDNAALTSDHAPGVAMTSNNGSRIATAEWAHFIGPRRSLNIRYLHLTENNEDTPVTDLGYLPPFNPADLSAMGQYTDPTQANLIVGGNQFNGVQNYGRHEVRGTVSQFFDVGRTSHALKAGAGFELSRERFNRLANGWGMIAPITQSGVPALRTRYFTPQAAQLGQGRTFSVFVQDSVTIAQRTSVNAGVLLNRDEFSQTVDGSGGCPPVALTGGAAVYESHGDRCAFLRFGFGDEIQPRLGVSYQVRSGKSDKAYANWGRYYGMDQKSSGRSLAPSRIFQTQTIFDLRGAVLSSGPLASTTGKMIDPALKPTYTDEILLGYATPITEKYSLDVFYMARAMHNFIEDVPSRMNGTAPDAGPFVAANLPCVAFASCRAAAAQRTYKAVTVDLQRRLADGWMSDVNYTWSRFEGNYDLDYGSTGVFNTSSFIQDAPGTNVEDPNRFGPLFEDRPHLMKLFASYAPTTRLMTSGFLRVQAGTPWAARGRDWAGPALNYLEPAGSHRNPTWTNLDLMASYRLPARGRATMTLEARLLNVFGNQTRLSTDAQQYLDLRTLPAPPYFAPYLQPNPLFGSGNAFAPPRRLYLALGATF